MLSGSTFSCRTAIDMVVTTSYLFDTLQQRNVKRGMLVFQSLKFSDLIVITKQ